MCFTCHLLLITNFLSLDLSKTAIDLLLPRCYGKKDKKQLTKIVKKTD